MSDGAKRMKTESAAGEGGQQSGGKKTKLTMFGMLMLMVLVPVVALTISVVISVGMEFNVALTESIFQKLKVASQSLATSYEYDITDEASAQKIFETAEEDQETIDILKDDGIEQTVFIGDVRAQTSVMGEDGKRVVNTKAAEGIWDTVRAGNDYQAKGVTIGTKSYYVYYSPLHTNDGKVVGMAFAGESDDMVQGTILKATFTIVGIIVFIAIILVVIVIFVARKVTGNIRQVVTEANRLAQGDLTESESRRKDSAIRDVYEILNSVRSIRANFTRIIANTSSQLNNVNADMGGMGESVMNGMEVSTAVTGAVTEITSGATETAESIQNVTASMQEIGLKIDSITETADSTTDKTSEIMRVSAEASQNLTSLMEANRNTIEASDHVVEGITNASQASQKISEVVQTVEEIAEETKLLSLNASIEAARAGEAGRGFAVVADSIQGLANQSTNSVNEIREIIQEITEASDNNVRLANEIKDAINSEGVILKNVYKSFEMVTERMDDTVVGITNIKDSANELNQSKNSVLDEVSSLSALSQETAASCQQTSSSMQELNTMMEGINQRTSKTKDVCDDVISTMDYFKIN